MTNYKIYKMRTQYGNSIYGIGMMQKSYEGYDELKTINLPTYRTEKGAMKKIKQLMMT